jgi:hypothetical protein
MIKRYKRYWVPIFIGSELYSKLYETIYKSKDDLISQYIVGPSPHLGKIIELADDLIISIVLTHPFEFDIDTILEYCIVYKRTKLDFDFQLIEKALLKLKIKDIL